MSDDTTVIRAERADDAPAIAALLNAAFPSDEEARVVDALRAAGAVLVSMVAEAAGSVVGHAIFSRAHIARDDGEIPVAALGPMAVAPDRQRRGIGSALIRAGLAACRARGETAAIVLGHAEYYPKFGFVRADTYGVRCEFPVPPEVFMALALTPDALDEADGEARYHRAFHDL